ncbi:hypothetical protein ACP70R_028431 [Stipagrostis hirtigluma subsp. patula]
MTRLPLPREPPRRPHLLLRGRRRRRPRRRQEGPAGRRPARRAPRQPLLPRHLQRLRRVQDLPAAPGQVARPLRRGAARQARQWGLRHRPRGCEFVPDRFVVAAGEDGDEERVRQLLEHVVRSNGPETGAAAEGNKQYPRRDMEVAVGRLMVAELFRRYDTFAAGVEELPAWRSCWRGGVAGVEESPAVRACGRPRADDKELYLKDNDTKRYAMMLLSAAACSSPTSSAQPISKATMRS